MLALSWEAMRTATAGDDTAVNDCGDDDDDDDDGDDDDDDDSDDDDYFEEEEKERASAYSDGRATKLVISSPAPIPLLGSRWYQRR